MPITGSRTPTDDARTIEAGLLLLGVGALVLFVSLFLDWYEPGFDAWTAFEAWDLVLAATAAVALFAVAGRMGFTRPRPASWLLGPAAVALIVVLAQLIDPPPAAAALGGDPDTGLWLALAGSVLMMLGAVLCIARISVSVNVGEPVARGPIATGRPLGDPVPDPEVEAETVRTPRRFAPGTAAAAEPPHGDEPVAGQRPPTGPTRPL